MATYDPRSDGSEFRGWFGAKPSQIEKAQRIHALRVIRPGLTEDNLETVSEDDLEKITKEFEEERAKGNKFITPKFLNKLGKKYGFIGGKCYFVTILFETGN